MCTFFSEKDFSLYSPILLTVWVRYLQARKKESCMYLSCQLFFKTPHKTLKFQQKLLSLQTEKNISKHDRMEVFSSNIHGKKVCLSTRYMLCLCSQKECRKCISRQSADLNFKKFSFAVQPEDTSKRQ